MEWVILVNEADQEIGKAEKIEAHKMGLLHRAFSILLFNQQGEMLLQKRSSKKYHGGGLWTNACCSHPRPGEEMEPAVRRRVMEELQLKCSTLFLFKTRYNFEMKNGLREHELDHVFVGKFSGNPLPNPEEIEEVKLISMDDLKTWVEEKPDEFSPWFKLILNKMESGNYPIEI